MNYTYASLSPTDKSACTYIQKMTLFWSNVKFLFFRLQVHALVFELEVHPLILGFDLLPFPHSELTPTQCVQHGGGVGPKIIFICHIKLQWIYPPRRCMCCLWYKFEELTSFYWRFLEIFKANKKFGNRN